jgi:predicted transcriptional regulator/transcriptional regulator with XRE-family HTH domain
MGGSSSGLIMARHGFLGHKLRRLRRQSGLTQVAMAEQLEISPSYLNLIEHNQRALTLPLIAKLTEQLGMELEAFSGNEEARTLAELTELLSDPLFAELQIKRAELNDVVGSAPMLCRAILQLYRAYLQARDEVHGLSQRLTEDPFLAESSHRLLTLLTSVRSFSEILQDNVGLAEVKRREFAGILVQESENLTELVNQLFEFIRSGRLGSDSGTEQPADAVGDIIQKNSNYYPELEEAAADLAGGFEGGISVESIRARLWQDHGVTLEVVAPEVLRGEEPTSEREGDSETLGPGGSPEGQPAAVHGPGHGNWRYDADHRRLLLAETLPPASRLFRAAQCLGLITQSASIEARVSQAGLGSSKARDLYRQVLANYLAGAAMMPYDPFFEEARRLRYDLERLGQRFGASFEQVCHRLTNLQRPGREGVPFHFLRVDMAGNILKRFSASGLNLPRYGGVCPLWNLHSAFLAPGRIDRQIAEFPDGSSYLFLAQATARPDRGYGGPRGYHSVGIGCDVNFAAQLVYADGLDLARKDTAVPVGVNCRQCPRRDCDHRAFPALLE